MDWGFTEEQDEIGGLARQIFEGELTEERYRAVEEAAAGGDADRFDAELWSTLAGADLLGISLPSDLGGGGYRVIEQCRVLTECGRAVAPVPLLASIVMGALPVATFGSEEQRKELVPKAIDGSLVLTAALVEPLNPDASHPETTAVRDAGGWRLSGEKTCVPAGMLAGLVLVPAMAPEGVGVFLVDPTAEGVTRTAQRVADKGREAHLVLDGAVVPESAVLGSVERGVEVVAFIERHATVGLVAYALGVTERAVEMTAEYTKGRVQFDVPIASFQAVGQRAADAWIDVAGIRHTLWQAAWRLSEDLPCDTEIEVAKFWASDAGHRVVHAAVHLHGGMGVDTDYPIHRYFLAAKQAEFTLGHATEQLLRIGRTLAAEPA
ncbi:MAG: acyl-CoA/acyl-ACP dehydrogenase [Actinobacteria bacterium]|nr:acyl-CoA/acyl-ACP dehydrogenase [Actinomycetota bacterium]